MGQDQVQAGMGVWEGRTRKGRELASLREENKSTALTRVKIKMVI